MSYPEAAYVESKMDRGALAGQAVRETPEIVRVIEELERAIEGAAMANSRLIEHLHEAGIMDPRESTNNTQKGPPLANPTITPLGTRLTATVDRIHDLMRAINETNRRIAF